MNKNILLIGAWKNNLGDDLFLKIICQRYPSYTFHIVTSKKYHKAYVAISNLKCHFNNNIIIKALNYVFRKMNISDIYYSYLLNKCDTSVLLGGSLFQQEKKWKLIVKKRTDIVKNSKASFVIGSNFGPYYEKAYYNTYNTLLSKMKDVCFRDKYSVSLFPQLKARFAPDVVLTLKSPQNANTNIVQKYNKPYVIISPINLDIISISRNLISLSSGEYEDWIIDLSINLEKQGMSIVLMSFCKQENDDETIMKILEKGKNKLHSTYVYSHENIEESLSIIANSEYVVATRFHAMILSWLMKKPVLPIVYGEKMRNVICEYGFTGKYYEINDLPQCKTDFDINELSTVPDIEKLISQAEQQFSALEKWMKSHE